MLASTTALAESIQELRVAIESPERPSWAAELVHPRISACLQRYLDQLATFRRPKTVTMARTTLVSFFIWLQEAYPKVAAVADLKRQHIEDWKLYESHRVHLGHTISKATVRTNLSLLSSFLYYLTAWGWEDAPDRRLIFREDFPKPDDRLPRFLGDDEVRALLRAAKESSYLFGKVSVVTLLFTGMRVGEFVRLTTDSIVKIGSAEWIRIPVGKLHNDRYIPLHTEVRRVLDEWVAHRDPDERSHYLFARHGRHYTERGVHYAVGQLARAAGIAHVSPHQLRHTMATQAINNGMSLESLAALLGHRSLRMTLVYAKIADKTVQAEYSKASQKLEALCDKEILELPAQFEGPQMARLRREMDWRLLGNGYCTRHPGMKCEYETICETCAFFWTTEAFLPTLHHQLEDAERKGQTGRARVFTKLLAKLKDSPQAQCPSGLTGLGI
jgi:site-specific recombinase XerD